MRMQEKKTEIPMKERLIHGLLIPCCGHLIASGIIAGLALDHMARNQKGHTGDMFVVAILIVAVLHSVLLLLCIVTNAIIVIRARSSLSRMRRKTLLVALLFLLPTIIFFL